MRENLDNWHKASYSTSNTGCVEIGSAPGLVGIRDTKQAHLGDARDVLAVPAGAFASFVGQIKADKL